MGIVKTVHCDGCGEECKYYFSIESATIKSANGKRSSGSIGFREFKIENRQFCSSVCFENWFANKLPDGDRSDYFFPGDQIGKKSVNDTFLGK